MFMLLVLRVCVFFGINAVISHSISVMRRRSRSCNTRIASLLLLLRIVAYISGVAGLCMLFVKNTRVEMIKTYCV